MQLFSGDKPKPAEPKPAVAKPAPAVDQPTKATAEPTTEPIASEPPATPTSAPEKIASHATADVGAEVSGGGGAETTEDAS
jgi:hypothetical protein